MNTFETNHSSLLEDRAKERGYLKITSGMGEDRYLLSSSSRHMKALQQEHDIIYIVTYPVLM